VVVAGQGGTVGRKGVPGRAVAGQAERDQAPEQRPGRARGLVPQAAATASGVRGSVAMASATPLAQAAATTADCW